jgi:hypothetical protein
MPKWYGLQGLIIIILEQAAAPKRPLRQAWSAAAYPGLHWCVVLLLPLRSSTPDSAASVMKAALLAVL